MPKFVGVENAIHGYQRNGIPPEVARLRSFAGCHHFALPGREYTLATGSTLNLAAILDVALHELYAETRRAYRGGALAAFRQAICAAPWSWWAMGSISTWSTCTRSSPS